MSQATFDPGAFRAFEVAGWEQKAEPYHRFNPPEGGAG